MTDSITFARALRRLCHKHTVQFKIMHDDKIRFISKDFEECPITGRLRPHIDFKIENSENLEYRLE